MERVGYPERPSSDGLRVATMNVWPRRGTWAGRRRVLPHGFRALRPDLASFVESIKTDDYDQVTDVFGPEYYAAHQKDREAYRTDSRGDEQTPYRMEGGQGVSIASRWPLGEMREVDLDVTRCWPSTTVRPASAPTPWRSVRSNRALQGVPRPTRARGGRTDRGGDAPAAPFGTGRVSGGGGGRRRVPAIRRGRLHQRGHCARRRRALGAGV